MAWPRRTRIMLVTGSTGYLGRHLLTGHAVDRWELIAPSSKSIDIRHRDFTIEAIRDWKPNVVVHLAYDKADRTAIVEGSANVADGAVAAKARLIHMSSDVVFPGQLSPYREEDPTRPVFPYGRFKRDAELEVQQRDPGAVIIRTSLLYGTARPSPLQTQLADLGRTAAGRRAITWFTDEIRCPAHADDVADAIGKLASNSSVSGPLHVAGPESVSRAKLARLMLKHMGYPDDDLVTSTIEESGMQRPTKVILDVSKAASMGITCRPVSEVLAADRSV
ncbi:MAG: sugar nucleotide-binding protein [Actinomycetota bacterium]